MKRVSVLGFMLCCFLVFVGSVESQMTRPLYADSPLVRPLYVGSFNYNNQSVPMSLSIGYRLYFLTDSITFSRNNRPDVVFSDHLGINSSQKLNEFFLSGSAGNLTSRYYYEHTRIYSGSGSLTSDQYLFSTPASTSRVSSLITSIDGKISSNRLEIGYPVYFSRLSTTIEPFLVGEWISRSFTLTSQNNAAAENAVAHISGFSDNLNSMDTVLYGAGINYAYGVSTNGGLTFKYLKTISSKSNNSLFDVEYRYYIAGGRNLPNLGGFFTVGYTYRTHSYGLNVGDLKESSRGPYLGLAVNF